MEGTSQNSAAESDNANNTPITNGAIRLALRLVKGATSAHTDGLIEAASRVCEVIAGVFGAFVFVGVVEEVVLPILGYDPIWSWPGALVALGVGGELWFSFRATYLQRELSRRSSKELSEATNKAAIADQHAAGAWARAVRVQQELTEALNRLAEAEKEAGEARERAAAAELKIEQLKLPRTIDAGRFRELFPRAAIPNAIPVQVPFDADAPDAHALAAQLSSLLSGMGWPATSFRMTELEPSVFNGFMQKYWNLGAPAQGLAVFTAPGSPSVLTSVREALGRALRASIIPDQEVITSDERNVRPGTLRVIVAAKKY